MLNESYVRMGGVYSLSPRMSNGGLQYSDILVTVAVYASKLVATDFVWSNGRLCTYMYDRSTVRCYCCTHSSRAYQYTVLFVIYI